MTLVPSDSRATRPSSSFCGHFVFRKPWLMTTMTNRERITWFVPQRARHLHPPPGNGPGCRKAHDAGCPVRRSCPGRQRCCRPGPFVRRQGAGRQSRPMNGSWWHRDRCRVPDQSVMNGAEFPRSLRVFFWLIRHNPGPGFFPGQGYSRSDPVRLESCQAKLFCVGRYGPDACDVRPGQRVSTY